MKIIEILLQRKSVMLLATMMILLAGFLSSSLIKQELLPEINFNGATYSLFTKDQSVIDLENQITVPIENGILELDNVDKINSETKNNSIKFDVIFNEDDVSTFNEIELLISSAVETNNNILDYSSELYSTNNEYEMYISLGNMDRAQIDDTAVNLYKQQLEKLNEVKSVDFLGLNTYEYNIIFNENSLNENEITAVEVTEQLNLESSRDIVGSTDKTVFFENRNLSDEELMNSIITTSSNDVELKDIASLERKLIDGPNSVWKDGDSNSLLMLISRNETYSSKEFSNAIGNELKKLKSENGTKEIELSTVINHSDYIDSTISDLITNIMIGGAIALISLILFTRNFSSILTIGLTIPIALSMTFFMMWMTGMTINLLTLIGLGLGIGIMIDSNIVVIESIGRSLEKGHERIKSIINGLKEVISPIITSVLSTIIVFLPIGLIGEEIGDYIFVLSVTLVATLLSSLFVSIFLAPTLAQVFLRVKEKENKSFLLSKYKNILSWLLAKNIRSVAVIILFALLSVSGLFLFTQVPLNLMPDLLNRQAQISIMIEEDATKEEKEKLISSIHYEFMEITDIKSTLAWNINDEHLRLHIDMTGGDEITRDQEEINTDLMSSLKEIASQSIINEIVLDNESNNGIYPIEMHLAGDDIDGLIKGSDKIVLALNDVSGFHDINHNLSKFEEQLELTFNKTALKQNEIQEEYIYDIVSNLINDQYVGNIQFQDEKYPLFVNKLESFSKSEELLSYSLEIDQGESLELSNLIGLTSVSSPKQLLRENGERYVKISANVNSPLSEVKSSVDTIITDYNQNNTNEHTLSASGILVEQEQAISEYILVFVLALGLAFLIVAFQLKSLRYTLIIYCVLPFSLTGGILGLFVTNKELNALSAIGFIILVGIVLNNSILLLDRLGHYKELNIEIKERILSSVAERWRPIMLTTVTTIIGMIPLAVSSGSSTNYQAPLAIVVIFGLLFSTIITLLIVPSIYYLVESVNRKEKLKSRDLKAS